MLLGREELCHGDDGSGEERTEEEAQEDNAGYRCLDVGDLPVQDLEYDGQAEVDADGELLADATRDEAQDNTSASETSPEAGDGNTGEPAARVTHTQHEGGNPSAQADLGTNVAKEEEGDEPGDGCSEDSSGASRNAASLSVELVPLAVGGSRGSPEGRGGESKFKNRETDHDIVVSVPLQAELGDHGGGEERRNDATDTVGPVDEAEEFVGVAQIPDPGVPGAVVDSVAEACAGHGNGEDPEGRRVQCHGNIAKEAEERAEKGDAALANSEMNTVVEEGGDKVAEEGNHEDGGHGGVVNAIVGLDLKA